MDGCVVWLTGLPATGKSTIARMVDAELRARGVATLMLDSDDLRAVLTPCPSYSDEERDWFYTVISHLAELGAKGGAVVLAAATAPKRNYRDRVRASVERFLEVLLICEPALLEERDPKKLYERFRRGEITNFPGRDLPYEDPLAPELVFDTGRSPATDVARAIVEALERPAGDYHRVTAVRFQ